MDNDNQYSSESNSDDTNMYSSQESTNYTSETEAEINISEDSQKYQIAKPKRIIIKARLIND